MCGKIGPHEIDFHKIEEKKYKRSKFEVVAREDYWRTLKWCGGRIFDKFLVENSYIFPF